jgi:hypothetical protein
MLNMVPEGTHALSRTRPAGASTRDISPAAAIWSGAKMTANTDMMTSAPEFSSGIEAASPIRNSTFLPSLSARARATSRSLAAGSTPVTRTA